MAGQNGLLFSKVPRHRSAVYLRIEQSSQLKQEFFIIFQCPLDGEQFIAGGFSAQPPPPAPVRSYTVSPSVSVRACPALPYVLSTPTDADLPSRYSLRRSCLGRGLCRIPGKSTPARQGLLFRSTEHRIQNKAGWMERNGLP